MDDRTWLASAVLLAAVGCNQAPTAGTIAIAPEDPFSSDPLQLVVSEEFTDPDGDSLDYRILWSRDGEAVTEHDGARTIPASATQRGETWSVQVVADDGRALSAIRTAEVSIRNAPPRIDSLEISPSTATTEDVLTATARASDPDGDETTVQIRWEIDGQPAGEGSTLPALSAARGQDVVAIASVDDGSLPGEEMRSAALRIDNAPPSIRSVSISPSADVTPSTELGCFVSGWSDADLDPPGYRYEWFVDGTLIGSSDVLSGGLSAGDQVTCQVTPSDGYDDGETLSSAPVTVGEEIVPECPPADPMPAEPYSGVSIDPVNVSISGVVAYDSATNAYQGWCSAEGQAPLAIDLLVYDALYESTSDLRYVCGLRLVADAETVSGRAHDFDFDFGSGSRSYTHYGLTLSSGQFTVQDRRFETSSGVVGGCLARSWDSRTWGSDIAGLFEDLDWGIYVGEAAPDVLDSLEDSDDPLEDQDPWSLYGSGYLFGASTMTDGTVGSAPILYGLAYEADELWAPVLDGDSELVRLRASTAVPSVGRPATGLYSLSSVYIWRAEALLIP